MKRKMVLLGFLFILLSNMTFSQKDFRFPDPAPQGFVNDFEGIFSKEEILELNKIIINQEKQSAFQIVIVSIKSFAPFETLSDYSLKIANYWGVGQKGKNNGIAIVFGKQIRQIRIQIGKGLENKLSDEKGEKIIDNIIIPEFKKGDFYSGIKKGLIEIIKEIAVVDKSISAHEIGTKTVTDIDGNIYHTVIIGTQVWMIENLRSTKYRNGDPISNLTDDSAWQRPQSGAYCWYNNDESNKATYGALYNWYAIEDTRNITPTGWHVPSDAEWTTLTTYLEGESVAGGKLKETGFTKWEDPNSGATNSTGFSALPGGLRNRHGVFEAVGYNGFWWSSSAGDASYGWSRSLYYNGTYVFRSFYVKHQGFSIRCIRD